MNTRPIVTSLLSVFVVGLAGLALGGFDPSPFHLINRLDSVENVLDYADDQLKEILSISPDDIQPTAVANKLNSMACTLWNQNDRVVDVIEAYLSIPPDPHTPEEAFYAALYRVGMEASSIAERASAPPNPYTPEVQEALGNVWEAAMGIVETVYPPPPSDPIP